MQWWATTFALAACSHPRSVPRLVCERSRARRGTHLGPRLPRRRGPRTGDLGAGGRAWDREVDAVAGGCRARALDGRPRSCGAAGGGRDGPPLRGSGRSARGRLGGPAGPTACLLVGERSRAHSCSSRLRTRWIRVHWGLPFGMCSRCSRSSGRCWSRSMICSGSTQLRPQRSPSRCAGWRGARRCCSWPGGVDWCADTCARAGAPRAGPPSPVAGTAQCRRAPVPPARSSGSRLRAPDTASYPRTVRGQPVLRPRDRRCAGCTCRSDAAAARAAVAGRAHARAPVRVAGADA